MCFFFKVFFMTDTNVSSLVLKKGSNRYIFDPSGNLDLSNYYTKSEIDTKFNNYALKTEIPDTSSLATKNELNSVKSTATTANNTANSAKTTAQNALNTANSKISFGTCASLVQFNQNVTSLKTQKSGILSVYIGDNDRYRIRINGLACDMDYSNHGNGTGYLYQVGTFGANATLSITSSPMGTNPMKVGYYFS